MVTLADSSVSLLVLLVSLTNLSNTCRTYSGLGQPCVFPFRLNGTFYSECTTVMTRIFKKSSPVPMCPVRLENKDSLEASTNLFDWGECDKDCHLKTYSDNQEVYDEILALASHNSHLAKPFVLGRSVRGQPLVGLRLSQGVRQERLLLKPMVRLLANVHGNEALGRELLLHLARHLLAGYHQEQRIRRLLDQTDISLLPSINPDGYDRATEGECSGTDKRSGARNEENVDLNRNFPDWRDHERFLADINYDPYSGGRQPETLAIMNWSTEPFVLSANLHSGATLVTFPFDHYKDGLRGGENLTPDNDIFHHVSSVFTSHHPSLANLTRCYRRAEGGSENGASWYSKNSPKEVLGSLKDFSYLFTNNLELDLELSCCKFPRSYYLVSEWEAVKESLLSYLEQVHTGVKGVVSLEGNILAHGAEILVWNPDGTKRGKNVMTSALGEYWRILLAGPPGNNTYTVQARLEDCEAGGSGKVFESLKHRVIISVRSPLKEQDLRMRQVGQCGARPGQTDSTLSVREELEASLSSRLPKQADNNQS